MHPTEFRHRPPHSQRSFLLQPLAVLLLAASPMLAAEGDAGWHELVTLDSELRALREAPEVARIPQFGVEALDRRVAALDEVRGRLSRLDPTPWSTAGKVDYLLVWARANRLEFEHRVTRPWQRDPIFYLNLVRRQPYTEVPSNEIGEALAGVPALVRQAPVNLTEPNGELTDLALFHLESFDGVGQGEPYRDEPPAGTLGWYRDLCQRLAVAQPEAVPVCQEALEAVEGFRDWLRTERPGMRQSAGIGTENLDWYFRRARLLPYGVDEMVLLGEREFHRYRAAFEIVRNRNRDLPELELTQSAEQHEERTRQAETEIRQLIERQSLLTLPSDAPETFETDTFWSPRARTDRHFWEEIQFRNAFNNHVHASIPGHRFDGLLAARVDNPIRRDYGDSSRAEGWATYLEEMFLLAGLTREVPRADELFYAALMKRASRIYAETMMHSGRFTLEQANRYMIEFVPHMEEDLGRYDLEGYLRRPGLGSGYIIGKIQLEKLLSERSLQLGESFELGAFHDDLLSRGMIPLTLIRWEMTGADDEIRPLWHEAVGTDLSAEVLH